MKWLLEFVAALAPTSSPAQYSDGTLVVERRSPLDGLVRLRLPLLLFYVVWAIVATAFVFIGLVGFVEWARWSEAARSDPALGVMGKPLVGATVFTVGGLGLIFECFFALWLDLRRS